MLRMGVPVATPIRAADVLSILAAAATRGGDASALEAYVSEFFGGLPVRFLCSGRASLFATLRAAAKLAPGRTEVVIPAFVCPSVARAVLKADLTPVLCDVTDRGFGLAPADCARVTSRRTLAIVPAHLFGYPIDIAPFMEIGGASGAIVIEDAAQACGARFAGRAVGTSGAAGVFSFGMSKVIYAAGGGLAVFRDPRLVTAYDEMIGPVRTASMLRQAAAVATLAFVAGAVRSNHLGPLSRVWAAGLRGRGDTDDFSVRSHSAFQRAAARCMLPQLPDITAMRRRNAVEYSKRLAGIEGIDLPEADERSEPVYLRFPLIVHDVIAKAAMVRELARSGICASGMYNRKSYDAVRELAGSLGHFCATEYLVDRMVNLPTHPYLSAGDLARTVAAIRVVLAGDGKYRT